jgi:hypothetical protein
MEPKQSTLAFHFLRTPLEVLIITQIIKFLKKVSEKPESYKAPGEFKGEFEQLHRHIQELRQSAL